MGRPHSNSSTAEIDLKLSQSQAHVKEFAPQRLTPAQATEVMAHVKKREEVASKQLTLLKMQRDKLTAKSLVMHQEQAKAQEALAVLRPVSGESSADKRLAQTTNFEIHI